MELFWKIPLESARRPGVLLELLRGLAVRRARSWINFWENMLGAGFACVYARHFRKNPPALIHAAWGGAPATAAWILWRIDGHRYSAAAHAYDIYEHGGDWWLREKLLPTAFVHTSTRDGPARALVERGVPAGRKIACIRRGAGNAAAAQAAAHAARAVAPHLCGPPGRKKRAAPPQLRLYAGLRDAGFVFEARIAGDGPLRSKLETLVRELRLTSCVFFTGHLPAQGILDKLAWADVLVHTGVVAPSGDTATACPTSSPRRCPPACWWSLRRRPATTEAVTDGVTGLVALVDEPEAWLVALRRLATDDALAESLRIAAHRWVEENFDAHKNAARILARFEQAIATPDLNRDPR